MESNNNNEKITPDNILYLSFNLDGSCFNVGHTNGFLIYNTDPLKLKFKLSGIGEIKIVEILNKTNIVAIVGTYKNENYPPNQIMIWDDMTHNVIGLSIFKEEIIKVKINLDKLIILTDTRIHVLNMKTLEETDQFPLNMKTLDKTDHFPLNTCEYSYPIERINSNNNVNFTDLIAISGNNNNTTVLAWPNNKIGEVNIKIYTTTTTEKDKSHANQDSVHKINCHKSHIQCLTLNADGTILATASIKGTLIRLFNAKTGKQLQEVRRGSTNAIIELIRFSKNSKYLCVSSDKDSIHLFEIRDSNNPKISTLNQVSPLSFISNIIPTKIVPTYVNSEWSFTRISLSGGCTIKNRNNFKYTISFSQDELSIIIITIYGKCIKYEFKAGTTYIKKSGIIKWL